MKPMSESDFGAMEEEERRRRRRRKEEKKEKKRAGESRRINSNRAIAV